MTEQPSQQDDRFEDIKSKLQRYKREREELDKIRKSFNSQERARPVASGGSKENTMSYLETQQSKTVPNNNQSMHATNMINSADLSLL